MKETKISTQKNKEEILKVREKEDELRLLLIEGPDLLIQEKGTDEALDKRIEKVELIGGGIFHLKEFKQYIDDKINTYEKKFPQAYYKEVFRLNGWSIPENDFISQKPSIVGRYTKEIIYGRFPKEILPEIEIKNQYDIMGMRKYKHFQFLTAEGVKLLEKFIDDSIIIMKECKYWDEFVEKHAVHFGHPFQKSLFPY